MCGEDPPKHATARLQYRRRAEIGGSDGPTYKYKEAFKEQGRPPDQNQIPLAQGTAMPIASSSRPPPMPQLSQPRQPSPGMGSKGPKNPRSRSLFHQSNRRPPVGLSLRVELKSHSDPHLYRFTIACIHIMPDSGREAPSIQFNQLVLCTLSLYRMCPRIRRVGRGTHPGTHITPTRFGVGMSTQCLIAYIAYLLYAFPGARQGCYSIDP